jgi:hypothetical protein
MGMWVSTIRHPPPEVKWVATLRPPASHATTVRPLPEAARKTAKRCHPEEKMGVCH